MNMKNQAIIEVITQLIVSALNHARELGDNSLIPQSEALANAHGIGYEFLTIDGEVKAGELPANFDAKKVIGVAIVKLDAKPEPIQNVEPAVDIPPQEKAALAMVKQLLTNKNLFN